MYNKSKERQSIKVEKENENIELRKKIKTLTLDKNLVNKKETVWDRLSKVKKVPSTENLLGKTSSRPNLITKTSHRLQAFKQTSLLNTSSIQQKRKPLSPTSSFVNKRSSLTKKFCLQKSVVVTENKNQTFLHVMPVNELLTARSLSAESKSSSEGKVDFRKFSNTSNVRRLKQSSEDSSEEYKLAPLMSSYSRQSPNRSSTKILNNVREFLQNKDKSMALEDIELLKDIIKLDRRYRNLDDNPKLFKEILKTQLQNILKHEFIVKKAIDSLESSASLQETLEDESNKRINEIVSYSGHNSETQKFEVDVIFKNVPSLDKEIEILRALGEKLEATLRSTTSHRNRLDILSHRKIPLTPTKPLPTEIEKYRHVLKLKYEVYVLTTEYKVEESVQLFGVRHYVGIINEFHMAQKTIIELKRESDHEFYIPKDSESIQWTRTSFKKLKKTPNELLRHIKPKKSHVAFNVLEQDPVFFNNLFNKTLKLSDITYDLSINYHHYKENKLAVKQLFYDGGDSHICDKSNNEANIKSSVHNDNIGNKLQPIIRGKQRRRIRRCMTPMPIGNYYSPKNTLLKTILVGFVQMSIFIIFIMALTYPDFRC